MTEPAAALALTKIVATAGPAVADPASMRSLLAAGVSVVRLNFSHGTLDDHARMVAIVRAAADEIGREVAILGDLQGPKIRLGLVDDDVVLVDGATVTFLRERHRTTADDPNTLWSPYEGLADDVEPGHRVLIDDGNVRLLAVDRTERGLVCTVTSGGPISSRKGINLPDSAVSAEALAPHDLECVEWAVRNDVDLLALSFVGTAADVLELRAAIADEAVAAGRPGLRMPIVAKIERPGAVERIESIADEADAIMIARGDLGVEMDFARVPVVQKQLVQACADAGKPCIVATQMLQSMIESRVPTRAEATDVANAILDRIDAVMLSGETAVGRHPSLVVESMRRIATSTEAFTSDRRIDSAPDKLIRSRYRTAALAHGAWVVAGDVGASAVAVWSQKGGGARYLSQNDFHVPILAASTDARALRQMALLRGVVPVRMELPTSLADFTRLVDHHLARLGLARPGERCVIVGGGPLGRSGTTNALAVHEIGSDDGGFLRHTESEPIE